MPYPLIVSALHGGGLYIVPHGGIIKNNDFLTEQKKEFGVSKIVTHKEMKDL